MSIIPSLLSALPSASVASGLEPLFDIAKPLVLAATVLAVMEELFEFVVHADVAHFRNAILQATGGLLASKAIDIFGYIIGPGFSNPFA
jgi:hypothetical protein